MLRDAMPRIPNPLRPFVNGFLWTALLILTLAVLLLVLLMPVTGETLGITVAIAGCLALSMLIAAGISAIFAGLVRRRLRRFQEGEYLVRWTYTPDEWQKFAEAEAGHTARAGAEGPKLGLFIAGFTGMALGGTAGSVLLNDWVAVVLWGLLGGVILGAFGAGLGWWIRSLVRGRAGRTRRRVLRALPVAYISRDAVYCAGVYWSWTWRFPVSWLAGLRLLPGEQTALEFTVCHKGKYGDMEYRYRVPVPAGRDAEARGIIETLCRR